MWKGGVSRQSSPCLPPSLHPKAASPLFIPLQGNSLIPIKMSQGMHKYIHNTWHQEFHGARGALLLSALLGCHLGSPQAGAQIL